VAIDGLGGIGKSTLAMEAAWRLTDRLPDGQLYLDLCGSGIGLNPLPRRMPCPTCCAASAPTRATSPRNSRRPLPSTAR
jgi:hypothetical protein